MTQETRRESDRDEEPSTPSSFSQPDDDAGEQDDAGEADYANYDSADISSRIRDLRLRIVNWSEDWGSQANWDKRFDDEINIAEEEDGDRGINLFLWRCERHVEEGQNILSDVKFIASGCGIHSHGEVIDLFLQGLALVREVAEEVKFFEVKMDQYHPAVVKKFTYEVVKDRPRG